MGYLGKSINMALLALLIGIVIILVSITVFFQFGLKDRTSAYESTSENLTVCMDELSRYEGDLSSAQKQLNSTAQDIRRYDQLYESKVAELADAKDELDDAESQITTLKLIKVGLESEKSQLKQTINTKEQEITQLEDEVDRLKDDINDLEDRIDCCLDTPLDCSSC